MVSEQHINTNRVRQAFSRSARTYDAHAALQREVAERLIAHLDFTRIQPQRVLDIGCGTGFFTRLLRKRFAHAYLAATDIALPMAIAAQSQHPRRMPWAAKASYATADACRLPFADGSFDLVASSLTLQWLGEPQRMLSEMRRVLAPGGLLLFSTFGRRTLAELRQSLADFSQGHAGLVLPFPDVTSLGDTLMTLPLELPVTDSDLFTLTYPDTMALVRELKGLGASSSAIRSRPGGLYGRRLLKALSNTYEARYSETDGRVRATFEVLYAQAWYAEMPREFENVIPIETADGL